MDNNNIIRIRIIPLKTVTFCVALFQSSGGITWYFIKQKNKKKTPKTIKSKQIQIEERGVDDKDS